MTPNDFPLSDFDQDTQRRRALAKVYALLIRLAEAAEKNSALPDHANRECATQQPVKEA